MSCEPDNGYLVAQLSEKLLLFKGSLSHVSIPPPELGLHLQTRTQVNAAYDIVVM